MKLFGTVVSKRMLNRRDNIQEQLDIFFAIKQIQLIFYTKCFSNSTMRRERFPSDNLAEQTRKIAHRRQVEVRQLSRVREARVAVTRAEVSAA
jgi:hypothetical protein